MITYDLEMAKWTERKFQAIEDNGLLQGILERLSGTPARLEYKLNAETLSTLQWKDGQKWSILEEVGHLSDLESLWSGRIDDFTRRLPELRPADMSNTMTKEAGHNKAKLNDLLAHFRKQREMLLHKIRYTDQKDLEVVCQHPRLQTPMRIIDLAFFVAEHDDHHLAKIQRIQYLLS